MKMLALKAMMMAGAIAVATCLTANASAVTETPARMSLDTMKKGKMMKMKKGKKMKMKKDTTGKM